MPFALKGWGGGGHVDPAVVDGGFAAEGCHRTDCHLDTTSGREEGGEGRLRRRRIARQTRAIAEREEIGLLILV